jgi:hypothetical protein
MGWEPLKGLRRRRTADCPGGHETLGGELHETPRVHPPLLAAWGVYRHNVGTDRLLHPPVTPFVRLVGQLLLKAEKAFGTSQCLHALAFALRIECLGPCQSGVECCLRLQVCPLHRTRRWLVAQLGTNRLGRRRARTWVRGRLAHSRLELRDPFGARPRMRRHGKWAQRGTHHKSCCYSSVHHCAPCGSLNNGGCGSAALAQAPLSWYPLIPDQSGSRDQRGLSPIMSPRQHITTQLVCHRIVQTTRRRPSAPMGCWRAAHVDRIGRSLRVHRRQSRA